MANQRSSHRSQHPFDHVAVLDPDALQVFAVCTPPPRGEQTSPTGPPSTPCVTPEHPTPRLRPAEPIASRTAHVSLLAATALGLAFSTGATDGNVRTLTILAEPDPGILLQASTAVLEIEVAPRQTRAIAAELLKRAARLAGYPGESLDQQARCQAAAVVAATTGETADLPLT